MAEDFVDDKSTLVQLTAWYHQAGSHCLSPCRPGSLMPHGTNWWTKCWHQYRSFHCGDKIMKDNDMILFPFLKTQHKCNPWSYQSYADDLYSMKFYDQKNFMIRNQFCCTRCRSGSDWPLVSCTGDLQIRYYFADISSRASRRADGGSGFAEISMDWLVWSMVPVWPGGDHSARLDGQLQPRLFHSLRAQH